MNRRERRRVQHAPHQHTYQPGRAPTTSLDPAPICPHEAALRFLGTYAALREIHGEALLDRDRILTEVGERPLPETAEERTARDGVFARAMAARDRADQAYTRAAEWLQGAHDLPAEVVSVLGAVLRDGFAAAGIAVDAATSTGGNDDHVDSL